MMIVQVDCVIRVINEKTPKYAHDNDDCTS